MADTKYLIKNYQAQINLLSIVNDSLIILFVELKIEKSKLDKDEGLWV